MKFGFSILVIILAQLSENSVILFTVGSAIITFITFYVIYKTSKIKWLSICIFFLSGAFLLTMNGMRNYMAVAIGLLTLRFVEEKKPIKFLITVLIATSIHKSSLIFLLFYPLYYLKLDIRKILIILVGAIGVSFFISDILGFLLSWTSYNNYFVSDKMVVDPLYSMLIINTVLFLVFLFNYKNYSKTDLKYNFYLKLQLISVIICIFSFNLSQAYRLEQIFDFFQIITIPYNVFLLKNNPAVTKKIFITIISIILVMYSVYFVKAFVLSDANQVRDYTTIFNKEG